MIQIPVHNSQGEQVDTLEIDEQILGGEVRPLLLKQAFVRIHSNKRQGSANTKARYEISYSTRKLYKQKGTGNARRGSAGTNLMYHGAHANHKKPRSWRLDMPTKMRRLANRNALLAKAVDGEIRLIDNLSFDKPSTSQFAGILDKLKINRSCLVAVSSTESPEARSARNLSDVTLTQIDRLNVFDLLNHRYLLTDKATLAGWLERAAARLRSVEATEDVAAAQGEK
ncbi:MAG: 50S ribosomal protein L4 [Phycisphaeraceae bacterium]|nr:50S ribosomal protein L4 [Phycisphaeraceae bacterium]